MNYYNYDVSDTLKKLDSNKSGLTIEEYEKRLSANGKNILISSKKDSRLIKFFNQFKNLMILILFIAAIFSFVSSIVHGESIVDSLIIVAIVILNAILGFVQELKADKTIESLKNMQKSSVKVRRDNKIYLVDGEFLVPGDIILLEAGDKVPADSRIIYNSYLSVDESSLTGESISVEKITNKINGEKVLADRKNMIFSGTNVVYGKCEAVVCFTGMNTEIGKIASSLNEKENEITPLQRKIDDISKFLAVLILIIIFFMLLLGIIKKMELVKLILLAISLAVAAIPEGLPAVITIVLSLGMEALAKKNAIVRKMASVETLGSTEVICSDKTGTITQNEMTVREIFYNNKLIDIKDIIKYNSMFDIMILNNDSTKNIDKYIGDPTEVALYKLCEKYIDIERFRILNKRVYELPFDSDRKMMSTINKNEDGVRIYTKGSFDSIIKNCSYYFDNDKIIELTDTKKKELKQIEVLESRKAYRVLAYAYKELDDNYIIDKEIEKNLIFVGMTSMIDPPREDVKESIETCKRAGIRPIMITGDSLDIAVTISKEIGIINSEKEAITGKELDNMSENELIDKIDKYSVYARVSPMNKLSIVNAWKKKGKIVAMTGDGVNDAPALKASDIGVGMGISGTEVAKEVSDIILVDDSFSTIVTAVREGRRIFDNIRNTLLYLLTGNIAEIIIVFFGLLFGIEVFLPIQILYINLITDSIPAIALAFEKESPDILDRKIRKKDSKFFTPYLISKLLTSSLLMGFTILFIYSVFNNIYGIEVARSISFLSLIIFEMIYSYSCKNIKKCILSKDFFNNNVLNMSMILLVIIQIILFLTPIKDIFKITDLSIIPVLYTFLIILIVFIINELSKLLLVRFFKD